MSLELVHSQDENSKALGVQLSETQHSISNGAVQSLTGGPYVHGVPAEMIRDQTQIATYEPLNMDKFEDAHDRTFSACEEIETICESMYAAGRQRLKDGEKFCPYANELAKSIGVIQGLAFKAMSESATILVQDNPDSIEGGE